MLHGLAALAALLLGRRLGRHVFLVAGVAPICTFLWAISQAHSVVDGDVKRSTLEWVPALGLDIAFRLNGFALLMTFVISGIGVLVFTYASRYFGERNDLGRFAATLGVFAGSMLGIVWSDNLLGMFVFWELTSITSYLLIGFNDRSEGARSSALQALLVTGTGGLALLLGFVMIGTEAGTYSLTEVLADPPRGGLVTAGVVFVLIGAFTKSAQVPFQGWLPGAMEAPTPVSAYLHSATMVKAGVYVVAVFAPAFAEVGPWRPLIIVVGIATIAWAGYQAIRRNDLKLILAYSTISILGLLIMLLGLGDPKLTFAGMAVLVAHACYKAPLFMVAGVIDKQAGSRDIRRLTGLRHRLPLTFVAALLASASMAGLPLTLGFVAKEASVEGLLDATLDAADIALIGPFAFAALTVAAVWRFMKGGFGDKQPVERLTGHESVRATLLFILPASLLAGFGIVTGVFPQLVDWIVGAAATSVDPTATDLHLHALPSSFTAGLAISLAGLGAGALLAWWSRPVEQVQTRLSVSWTAAHVFHASVAGLLRGANRVARVTQSGSLPAYLGIILTTLVVAPGVVLVGNVSLPDDWVWADSPLQVLAALAVMAAVAGVVFTHRRFAAVIALGAVGYGVAVLFVAHGAPDLALTQFLVETVVVVGFLLVLRRLPETFRPMEWRARRITRLAISLSVGVFVFAFTITMVATRTAEPPTATLAEIAEPLAGGKNVVNVILGDIRALDTLGEVTVLGVAAIGVISLATRGRGRREQEVGK